MYNLRTIPRLMESVAALALGAMFAAPAAAQTITAVMQSPLRVLDPVVSSAAITNIYSFMVYDTLLGTDENFEIQPQMAESWEISEDGLTYTFTLREGLLWHDGEPVTAADCVASIERWGSQDIMGQLLMSFVESIETLDERRFAIHLSEPTDMVLAALAKIGTRTPFMMPERVANTPPDEQITDHTGSGPFVFVEEEFQPGIRVVFEKFEDYVPREEEPSWTAGGKVVNVDRVEWTSMPDALTASNSLIAGEIDYLEAVPYDLLQLFEDSEDVSIEVLDELGLWTYYRFNFLYPPFDDPGVRQAAILATGQEPLLQALTGNPDYYRVCVAVFGCGTPYASDYGADRIIEAQPEAAQAKLEEAGYDGTPVVILHPTDNPTVTTQPVVIADALREAGFTVDLQSMDWQTLTIRRASQDPPSEGGWNIHATTGPLVGITDPLRNQAVATSGMDAWYGWPDFPEIEELRAEFARASNEEEKQRIAAKIQELVIDNGVVVPMGQFTIPTGYRNELSGVLKSPVPVFWNIEKAAE